MDVRINMEYDPVDPPGQPGPVNPYSKQQGTYDLNLSVQTKPVIFFQKV